MKRQKIRKFVKSHSEAIYAWGTMFPGLAILFIFVFFPIIFSIPLSLTDYSVVGEINFVGFENFKRAFSDSNFIVALFNSMKYVLVVPIIQIVSLAFAVLLNQKIRGTRFFRMCYYFPVITSTVAVSIVWNWLLSNEGIVNKILLKMNLISESVGWLSNNSTALWVLMFITAWKGFGYYMVIYLAGLQSVPYDLIEAAKLDRANSFQIFIHVIIPMLKPQVVMCTLLSLISALKVFDEPFVLTNGGPGNSTLTASLYIYQKGFQSFDFGYAAALSLILSCIILVFSIIVNVYQRKGENN